MLRGRLALALTFIMCGPAVAADTAQEHARTPEHPERVCLSVQQARDTISLNKLVDPFRVTTGVARQFHAETLRVKLCRRKDEFIYEISLLQRDGRVIRVYVSAVTGKIVKTVNAEIPAAQKPETTRPRGRFRQQ